MHSLSITPLAYFVGSIPITFCSLPLSSCPLLFSSLAPHLHCSFLLPHCLPYSSGRLSTESCLLFHTNTNTAMLDSFSSGDTHETPINGLQPRCSLYPFRVHSTFSKKIPGYFQVFQVINLVNPRLYLRGVRT